MKPPSEPIQELDIHAYVDGLLDPARRSAVQRHLSLNAEDAEKAEDYKRQNEAIKSSFDDITRQPAPDRILASIYASPASSARHVAAYALAAATVCSIVLAGLLGWQLGRTKAQDETIVSFIQEVRTLALQTSEETAAATSYDLAAASPLRQISRDLAVRLSKLGLEPEDLKITLQQVIRHNGQEIAQLSFKDRSGQDYTLFATMRSQYRGPSYRLDDGGEQRIAYWADGPVVFALASTETNGRLMQFAEAIDRAVCTEDQKLSESTH